MATSTSARPANKALSTSTLSLKFMQNAHRAKQLAQVELEQAKVKDEAEWEVAKEVREGWGGASGSGSGKSVVYEASYMPFLFDRDGDVANDDDEADVKPKGRRTFGKHGQEVEEVTTVPTTEPAQAAGPRDSGEPRRLTSISGSGSSSAPAKTRDLRKPLLQQQHRDPEKAAKNIIRDISGVGVDLRTARARAAPTPIPPKPVPAQPAALEGMFMKPAGVDMPKGDVEVVQGARAKSKSKSSVKRQREGDAGANANAASTVEGQREGKKKKKKKVEVEVEDNNASD
ncbi:hypothetical protein FIBSPDRAFT_374985 [Athelia psychrophila]|uniref:Uncharacterized protein n=1 Tax=Athelia psychrophila TaxID=1759441 RepID=A0A166VZ51_9AGAM|nr:hypothetical protein FIBSPDRAFT_374985 [Fibularhizoctonia sp. CBS 109695]